MGAKGLKTRTSNLADMLSWNVPTEFLKNYFQKGGGHRHVIP